VGQFNYGKTLLQVQQEVIQLTKEPQPSNPIFATIANVAVYANDAQLEINSKTLCRITSNLPGNLNFDPTLTTVVNQRLYPLPADFMSMIKVSVNRIRIRPSRFDDFANNVQWWKLPGFPQSYYFERNQVDGGYNLGLFPTPTSVWPLGLIYVPQPIQLVNPSDTLDLDPRLGPAVVKYVCWKIMEYRREESRGAYWKQQFYEAVANYEADPQDTAEPMQWAQSSLPSD